ncbi:hypothetical protein [Sphingomonas sp.]|uniref:hypothetical protein n=1 Tax=Sphingomonas sp. TaxID=28214 RepID=UPI003CC5A161
MATASQLARVERVRAVQLLLARTAQADAEAQVASETALAGRVAALAAGIAPAPTAAVAFSLSAAAHYRERLHQSSFAAQDRVAEAARRADAAGDAARDAERDLKAVEKLQARADAAAALAAIRALEGAPVPTRFASVMLRHDPC